MITKYLRKGSHLISSPQDFVFSKEKKGHELPMMGLRA